MIPDTDGFGLTRPMPFVEQPVGRDMEKKLWKETTAELSEYTTIPEILAS